MSCLEGEWVNDSDFAQLETTPDTSQSFYGIPAATSGVWYPPNVAGGFPALVTGNHWLEATPTGFVLTKTIEITNWVVANVYGSSYGAAVVVNGDTSVLTAPPVYIEPPTGVYPAGTTFDLYGARGAVAYTEPYAQITSGDYFQCTSDTDDGGVTGLHVGQIVLGAAGAPVFDPCVPEHVYSPEEATAYFYIGAQTITVPGVWTPAFSLFDVNLLGGWGSVVGDTIVLNHECELDISNPGSSSSYFDGGIRYESYALAYDGVRSTGGIGDTQVFPAGTVISLLVNRETAGVTNEGAGQYTNYINRCDDAGFPAGFDSYLEINDTVTVTADTWTISPSVVDLATGSGIGLWADLTADGIVLTKRCFFTDIHADGSSDFGAITVNGASPTVGAANEAPESYIWYPAGTTFELWGRKGSSGTTTPKAFFQVSATL